MNRKLNVYLCGSKIGVLSEDDLLQLSFQYNSNETRSLSVYLPIRNEIYSHAEAFPFFENLSPEGEAFEILTKNHVSENKIFSILDRFGGDCAGAVAFYEGKPENNNEETLHEISAEKFTQIIDKLPEDPLLTSLENPPRLSLAGAQSKFAVYKYENKYYRSNDDYPTTHIIKITNKRFPNLLKNELFCMKLAQIMELNVPDIELKTAGNHPYLEIERYDRYVENGIVRRVHQEDFCQALGLVSDRKYQTRSGVSLRNCCRVIEKFSENRLWDINSFVEWIVFNYLIGNTDAHAKNLSLLHTETGIKLAPFYDLLSTEVYSIKIVDHYMAMLINGKGRYDSVTYSDFLALFEQLGLNVTNMMKNIKNKFALIISIAEKLSQNLIDSKLPETDTKDNKIYDDIIAIIKKRLNILLK